MRAPDLDQQPPSPWIVSTTPGFQPPLPTPLLIFIGTLVHPLPGRFLSTSGSQWLGSRYNTFLWGAYATCTACLPHSNHFFAGLHWHSVHPWLRSCYNTHWLGAILLALYACPTSTTPANFILPLHSSTPGEPVKTPSMLLFCDPPAFQGL